jgi:glycosyltransferase involved in cell wall biosynthesis
MRLAIDTRTSGRGGVSRFSRSILQSLARQAAMEHEVTLIVTQSIQEWAGLNLSRPKLEYCRESGLVRDDPALRLWLHTSEQSAYFTANYLADPRLPLPFVFTIYDTIRFNAEYVESDDEALMRWGRLEFSRIARLSETLGFKSRQDGYQFAQYFRAATRSAISRAAWVLTVSDASKGQIESIFPEASSKVKVIRPGVDTSVFYKRTAQEVTALRVGMSLPERYCLWVGSTKPHKRLDWLIESVSDVLRRGPSSQAIVLLTSNHNGVWPHFADHASRADLSLFHIVSCRLSDEELAALYSGAQALIATSAMEGFYLPSHEALACGTVVIAPDIPVFRESLGRYGRFYAKSNSAELAELVHEALAEEAGAVGGYQARTWEQAARELLDELSLPGKNE